MKVLLYCLLFFSRGLLAQTDSTRTLGTKIGNQVIVPIPVAPPGYPMAQALIYYPDDYFLLANVNKRYPLYVFLHGAGEGNKKDIGEVLKTSLPQLISQGLKPYGIDPATGDTIKFIVVSPHCALCGGSYSFPQLQYTVPFIFSNYRVDTSCVFVGGLSSGGSCTWSMAMGNGLSPSKADTVMTKRITGIMPMANGGYDNYLYLLGPNLDTTARRGLVTFYVIGDQDPGYNAPGFFAYQAVMKKYSLPGRYFDSVRIGGTHSANVWNIPFPLTARVWSKTMNAWTQMWAMRKKALVTVPMPPISVPHAVIILDSTIINWPNTRILLTDSSYSTNGKIVNVQWTQVSGPNVVIWTSLQGRGMLISGTVPGVYRVNLYAVDSATLAMDTATAYFKVVGPTIPICPVCRPQRTVKSIQIDINGTKIFYNDGSTQ